MPQPDWAKRINYLGQAVGGANHLISLEADKLIDTAKATTGLSDFGDDEWRSNYYQRLAILNSIELGDVAIRLLTKTRIICALRQRLLVVDKLKRHPDILQERIVKPLLITGMGRTGSSILLQLLSQDQQFQSPLGYKAISPVAPPAHTLAGGISREKIAQGLLDFAMDIRPSAKTAHESSYALPMESSVLLEAIATFLVLPVDKALDYDSWSQKLNDDHYHRWHKILLQLLQYQAPKKTWLLKDPANIFCLQSILQQYPDIHIIHTHRDPLKAIPSILSLGRNSIGPGADGSGAVLMQHYADQQRHGLKQVIQQRQAGLVPAQHITDIHFQDLVNDPVITLQQAYNKLGYEFSTGLADKFINYLRHKPRHQYGAHQYSLEEFGLQRETLREQYQFYTDYYAIALED